MVILSRIIIADRRVVYVFHSYRLSPYISAIIFAVVIHPNILCLNSTPSSSACKSAHCTRIGMMRRKGSKRNIYNNVYCNMRYAVYKRNSFVLLVPVKIRRSERSRWIFRLPTIKHTRAACTCLCLGRIRVMNETNEIHANCRVLYVRIVYVCLYSHTAPRPLPFGAI